MDIVGEEPHCAVDIVGEEPHCAVDIVGEEPHCAVDIVGEELSPRRRSRQGDDDRKRTKFTDVRFEIKIRAKRPPSCTFVVQFASDATIVEFDCVARSTCVSQGSQTVDRRTSEREMGGATHSG